MESRAQLGSMDRKIEKKKWTTKKIVLYLFSGLVGVFIMYTALLSGGARLNVERNKINCRVHEGKFREFIPVDGNVLPIKTIRLDAIEGGVVPGNILTEVSLSRKHSASDRKKRML